MIRKLIFIGTSTIQQMKTPEKIIKQLYALIKLILNETREGVSPRVIGQNVLKVGFIRDVPVFYCFCFLCLCVLLWTYK